jgi:hypothetical protein
MMKHIHFALSRPVFDPYREIVQGHYFWAHATDISACLTVNIGLE